MPDKPYPRAVPRANGVDNSWEYRCEIQDHDAETAHGNLYHLQESSRDWGSDRCGVPHSVGFCIECARFGAVFFLQDNDMTDRCFFWDCGCCT